MLSKEAVQEKAIEQDESPYVKLMQSLRDRAIKLSFSSFSQFCKSPRHFIDYKLGKKEQTQAMFEGQVKHTAVLEPDDFDSRYTWFDGDTPGSKQQFNFALDMASGVDRIEAFCRHFSITNMSDTKISEKSYDYASKLSKFIEFQAQKGNRLVISKELYEASQLLKDHIYKNEASRWVMDQVTHTEKKVNFTYSGFKWHGYIDGTGGSLRVDLKFMDADPEKIRRKISSMRYDWQVGNFYGLARGQKTKDAFIIAVDPKGNISVVEIDKGWISAQWEDIERKMAAFKRCIFLNHWQMSYDFWVQDGIYKMSNL